MRKQKLYAYLDVESAYQLGKGNMQSVGQVYMDDPKINRTYGLNEGERYVFLMELPQLFEVLSVMRQKNIEKHNSGGVICEFALDRFGLKRGTFGLASYKQLKQGLYVPAVEEISFKGVNLTGCFTGNFVYDAECRYKKEEIIEMFRNQNKENIIRASQPGANE